MNKNEILNSLLKNNPIEKLEDLRFINKKLNQINNNINKYQHIYNLIKENENNNINFNFKSLLTKKKKIVNPRINLINQLNHIASHYQVEEKTENNKEHKLFKDKYNEVINSFNHLDTNTGIDNKINKKKYFPQVPHENEKRKLVNSYSQKLKKFNINNINDLISMKNNNNNLILAYRDNKASSPNINSYTTTQTIRVGFGDYAYGSIYCKKPRLYPLNYYKTKLQTFKTLSSNHNNKPKILSDLIPQNTKKIKLKSDFYNYYKGQKLFPKLKFKI